MPTIEKTTTKEFTYHDFHIISARTAAQVLVLIAERADMSIGWRMDQPSILMKWPINSGHLVFEAWASPDSANFEIYTSNFRPSRPKVKQRLIEASVHVEQLSPVDNFARIERTALIVPGASNELVQLSCDSALLTALAGNEATKPKIHKELATMISALLSFNLLRQS